jgi:4-hydroxybenzoate polyprenyltransferase
LLFAGKFLETDAVLLTLIGFGVLCALTGSVYIVNDIRDLEEDRKHQIKCTRPLCSGEISVTAASCIAVVLALSSITGGFVLDRDFGLVLFAYCSLNVLYSFWLKKMVILDVFCIATGFFLRVLGGAYIIHITPSPWLLICTFLVSSFLALLKRRHELITLGYEAGNHRKVLNDYSARFLDQMVGVVTAVTILSYMLWTVESTNIKKYGIELLITFPFVFYGMFRYLYLVHKKNAGGDPTDLIFRDFPLIVTILLWLVTIVFIMHKGLIVLKIGNFFLR